MNTDSFNAKMREGLFHTCWSIGENFWCNFQQSVCHRETNIFIFLVEQEHKVRHNGFCRRAKFRECVHDAESDWHRQVRQVISQSGHNGFRCEFKKPQCCDATLANSPSGVFQFREIDRNRGCRICSKIGNNKRDVDANLLALVCSASQKNVQSRCAYTAKRSRGHSCHQFVCAVKKTLQPRNRRRGGRAQYFEGSFGPESFEAIAAFQPFQKIRQCIGANSFNGSAGLFLIRAPLVRFFVSFEPASQSFSAIGRFRRSTARQENESQTDESCDDGWHSDRHAAQFGTENAR